MNAVDVWFAGFDNPMKPAMQRVREIILEDPRMTETIKWKTPTFVYEGHLASFNPRAKRQVSLLFHTGAATRTGIAARRAAATRRAT